ncbi:MAG TPA: Mur ligase domain-containing protein, partial [Beijerinckiaceae bacterium]|nr:Mur ligase domain-containing protein [Beijerinckiaceae bacterium]
MAVDAARLAAVLGLAADDAAGLTGACADSRAVRPGNVFFALAGAKTDGSRFAAP